MFIPPIQEPVSYGHTLQVVYFFYSLVEPSTLFITMATAGLLYYSRIIMDDDECGAVSGMLGNGNRSTRRKPAQLPLCPPQIPNYLTRARTRVSTVGSRQLTAWATTRPNIKISIVLCSGKYRCTKKHEIPATPEWKKCDDTGFRGVFVNSNSFTDASCVCIPTVVNRQLLWLGVLLDQYIYGPSSRHNSVISAVRFSDMLRRVSQEVGYSWDVCRATDGAHCESFRS
jgi:hypothetical protein